MIAKVAVSVAVNGKKQGDLPCAATVSCVAIWCNVALDKPSPQVGHGHVGSMGLKSFACLSNSDTYGDQGDS